MVGAQLQELLQVSVLSVLVSDATLVEDPEEVLCLHDFKGLVFGLTLHTLLVGDLLEELLGSQARVK